MYLQNRTIATWVGYDVINNIRAGVINPPSEPDHLTKINTMLGQEWKSEASLSTTPNPTIKKITVDVYHQPDDTKFGHLESYFYAG